MSVTQIIPVEQVNLDQDQLEVLYRQLGPVGADKVVNHALEELAALLSQVPVQYRAHDFGTMSKTARALSAVAQQVGMPKLARVARDICDLGNGGDIAALAAVIARLERIGDCSLLAVWELPNQQI